jgi:hypothetical protein
MKFAICKSVKNYPNETELEIWEADSQLSALNLCFGERWETLEEAQESLAKWCTLIVKQIDATPRKNCYCISIFDKRLDSYIVWADSVADALSQWCIPPTSGDFIARVKMSEKFGDGKWEIKHIPHPPISPALIEEKITQSKIFDSKYFVDFAVPYHKDMEYYKKQIMGQLTYDLIKALSESKADLYKIARKPDMCGNNELYRMTCDCVLVRPKDLKELIIRILES